MNICVRSLRILLSSYAFSPSIGGIESVSALLATEFTKLGHAVTVLTQTPGPDTQTWPFPILRQPGAAELLSAVRTCEIFWHNNISLRSAWPLLVARRAWVVTHQTWIVPPGVRASLSKRAKLALSERAVQVSISGAIAATLPGDSTIIGNPYQKDVFRVQPEVERDRDLVFLGRLVSDKGADMLLHALAGLREHGLIPSLSIIGSGPEEMSLRTLATSLKLEPQVEFMGAVGGAALAHLLNRHSVLVVPSRWAEPFGIVAIEGMACGCAVIGSSGGGLPEAIDGGGLVFESGSVSALVGVLHRVLSERALRESLIRRGQEHLQAFTPETIAARYLRVFARALSRD